MTSPYAPPYQAVNAAPKYEGWGVMFRGDMLAVGMSETTAKQLARDFNLDYFKAESDEESEQ